EVVVLGSAQEAEPIGQAFEHTFTEDEAALFRLRLRDLEDEFLLTQAGRAGDTHILRDLIELLNAHVLQLDEIERGGSGFRGLGGALFAAQLPEVTFRVGGGRRSGSPRRGRRGSAGGRRGGRR